jgi:SAM-dependent methyltransferase
MTQKTTGFHAALSSPIIYDLFQDLMGARTGRREWVRRHVRPVLGSRILDIGCGTARILDYLPDVEYYGFDLSQRYIEAATRRYGGRGNFNCALVDQPQIEHLEAFDIVMATGLLHHLDDEQAVGLMRLAYSALREGGRLVTIDPCYADDQNAASRFFVSRDRGQNIRDLSGYTALAKSVFANVTSSLQHRAWIPYTHCILECNK